MSFFPAPGRRLGPQSICAALLVVLATTVHAYAQGFIVLDAPGADQTVGSYNGTVVSGISLFGLITGYYVDANSVYHGFLRSPDGKYTRFEAPGADQTPGSYNGTLPSGINDFGAITGTYYDVKGAGHGFVRSTDGKITTFNVPGSAGSGSFPLNIGFDGTIVGYYLGRDSVVRAFLRRPDRTYKTFAAPGSCATDGSTGCYGSALSNINLFGAAVGGFVDNSGNFVQHQLTLSAGGKLQTFEAPGAGDGPSQGTGCPGCVAGINLWGAIASTYTDSNTVFHAYIRSRDGSFTTVDAPGAGTAMYQGTGCYADCSVSLNDFGALAGIYTDANYVSHGYLRSPEGAFTTIDPPGSQGTYAVNLNDFGITTGYYIDANNVYHGYVRVPKY